MKIIGRKCKKCGSDIFNIASNHYVFCAKCNQKIEYLEPGRHLDKTEKIKNEGS